MLSAVVASRGVIMGRFRESAWKTVESFAELDGSRPTYGACGVPRCGKQSILAPLQKGSLPIYRTPSRRGNSRLNRPLRFVLRACELISCSSRFIYKKARESKLQPVVSVILDDLERSSLSDFEPMKSSRQDIDL